MGQGGLSQLFSLPWYFSLVNFILLKIWAEPLIYVAVKWNIYPFSPLRTFTHLCSNGPTATGRKDIGGDLSWPWLYMREHISSPPYHILSELLHHCVECPSIITDWIRNLFVYQYLWWKFFITVMEQLSYLVVCVQNAKMCKYLLNLCWILLNFF